MTLPHLNTNQKESMVSTIDFNNTSSNGGVGGGGDTASIVASDYNPLLSRNEMLTMKIARMISKTLLGMAAILGFCIFLSASIQARSCNCSSYSDQVDESRNSPYFEPLTAGSDPASSGRRMPIRISMDGETGDMMRSGKKKGQVNCAVERKTASQIIASEPKMLITPYGNITTDPRIIHMTGEKMIFTCTSPKGKGMKKDRKYPWMMKEEKERKYGTVIRLNELIADEMKNTTPTPDIEPKEARPKRSVTEKPKPKEPLHCDCHC